MGASATSTAIAGLILGACLGYFYALGTSVGIARRKGGANDLWSVDDSDGDDEDEVEQDGAVDGARVTEPCKLVLVVRADLKMSKGKAAAQCGHATLACYKSVVKHHPAVLRAWEYEGQAKICLQAGGEEELLLLKAKAISLGLTAKTIQDAGRTEIAAGSTTVLGIGPAEKSRIDEITGHLKLYH